MKNDMKLIFGKEWTWFCGLSLLNKLRSAWFCVSLMMVSCVCEESGKWVMLAVAVNFVLSALSVRRLPLDEYGE